MIKEDDFIEKFKAAMESPMLQPGAKARRFIDMVEDLFARAWIYCRQVAVLVECFSKLGYYKQTKHFGTYRVELVITLFARILDIHNFEVVVRLCPYFYISFVLNVLRIVGDHVSFRTRMSELSLRMVEYLQPLQARRSLGARLESQRREVDCQNALHIGHT